ncbi:hypothetical protein [Luteococcus peritonei]|uniref:Uncharacterized protein n=1 Tax=Luteococcus peritonei TaxID=88874 RepID=A0ABW4RSA4_9ACTN
MATRKLDQAQTDAVTKAIAGVASTLASQVARDPRVKENAQKLVARVGEAASARDPLARIEQQLDSIEQAAAQLGEDPDQLATAGEWRRQVEVLRRKLPLVRAQDGRARRTSTKQLKQRTRALLDEVLRHGLED